MISSSNEFRLKYHRQPSTMVCPQKIRKKTSIATSLHGGDPEVSIEAVNDWQAQAFVAGLQGHAAEASGPRQPRIATVGLWCCKTW